MIPSHMLNSVSEACLGKSNTTVVPHHAEQYQAMSSTAPAAAVVGDVENQSVTIAATPATPTAAAASATANAVTVTEEGKDVEMSNLEAGNSNKLASVITNPPVVDSAPPLDPELDAFQINGDSVKKPSNGGSNKSGVGHFHAIQS